MPLLVFNKSTNVTILLVSDGWPDFTRVSVCDEHKGWSASYLLNAETPRTCVKSIFSTWKTSIGQWLVPQIVVPVGPPRLTTSSFFFFLPVTIPHMRGKVQVSSLTLLETRGYGSGRSYYNLSSNFFLVTSVLVKPLS